VSCLKIYSCCINLFNLAGVIRKLRHAKRRLFRPSLPLVTNSSNYPSPLKHDIISDRPLSKIKHFSSLNINQIENTELMSFLMSSRAHEIGTIVETMDLRCLVRISLIPDHLMASNVSIGN